MIRRIGYTLRDLLGLLVYWYRTARVRRQMPARVQRIAYGPHRRTYFLLAEPPDSRERDDLPWAVYLHGGGWTFGTPEAFLPAARPWLRAGYRVILPSYRRPPAVRIPDIVEDCRRAIAAAAAFAGKTGRPLHPPHIAGISAGGHLAATLALHPEWWTAAGWPGGPRRIALFAAPLSLDMLRPRRLFRDLDLLSPCHGPAAASGTEWLLVQGDRDGFVDPGHATRFLSCLQTAGVAVHLERLPAAGHLDAGRWTYDDGSALYALLSRFVRQGVGGLPGPA